MMKQTGILFAGATALLIASPASAAQTWYDTRANFNTAAGPTTAENFNAIVGEPDFRTSTLVVGAFSLTGFGEQFDRNFIDAQPLQFSDFNVDGTTVVNAVTYGPGGGFDIVFSSPITAFGADFAAFQDNSLRSTITINGIAYTPTIAASNAVRFIGVVSDTPFQQIRFGGLGNFSDGFGFDNVAFRAAAAVPEPATWAMMLLGFGVIGASMRRTRRTGAIAQMV